ncbi:DUF5134 domain-containing protein [Amycolatopsis alkalitolerans]|uniref:DUF5134 domain-containing protein n=1 Tax=Amycolatopsis alkalitolerans TaxID=2547244 RepID=A0A5C4M2Z6_9PSEU|nr:DUF5134 domain-containing protein [Amycolatopsis alkalitolerans]TNC24222.1 DUF5134 domain-containing protein [Amycolatopsis alkalitolerans]
MMQSALLPGWLRMVWAAALVLVALAHLKHVITMRGQRRWWHTGHTVMAAGMALMYLLPAMDHPVLYQAGLAFYVAAVAALAATTVTNWREEGVLNPLWVATTIDMVAMAYMLLPARTPVLTAVFVVYLAGQAVAWSLGLWSRVPVLAPVPAGGEGAAGSPASSAVVGLTAHTSPVVLASLAVMAAGMAYMLLAM